MIMKRTIGIVIALMLAVHLLYAQQTLFQKISPTIDANLNEWQPLTPVDEEYSWSYAIAKDDGYLYVAIEIKDPLLIQEVVKNGVMVNIDPKAKKNLGPALIYPYADRIALRSLDKSKIQSLGENFNNHLISLCRGYMVQGFPTVKDGLLSFENTYNIKSEIKIDSSGAVQYESAIPIASFQKLLKGDRKISIQLAIMTPWEQMKMLAKQKRSSNTMSLGRNPYPYSTEVWLNETL